MSTASVNVQYRPIRIGWCVQANDLNDYKKAIQLSHTLWGGRYNPIIPITSNDTATELVEFFKVDTLFPISETGAIIDFINKFPHLPWPHHFERGLFIKWMKKREPAFLDIYQAALRLRADLNKENAQSKFSLNIVKWEDSDPLSSVLAAMFGSFPTPEEMNTEFDYYKLIADSLTTNTIVVNTTHHIDPLLLQAPTINSLTSYLLSGKRSDGWSMPGFYMGDSNSFDDLVNFWNLRACGISLLYYDAAFKSRFSNLKESYSQINQSKISSDYDQHPANLAIWALESTSDALIQNEFGEQLTICKLNRNVWNGLNVKTPLWHFKRQVVLGSLSKDSHTKVDIQLPSKPIHDESIGFNQYLAASIKVFGNTGNDEETFATPYIPQLNLLYGQNSFEPEKVRVEPGDLGFIIQVHDRTLHLRSLKVKKLIEAIFNLYGMHVTPSHAGIKINRFIKQLGGLLNCRVFKVKGLRELIEKYKPTQSFDKSNAIQIIGQNDPTTNKPNFTKYERLYLEGKQTNPEKLFTFLVEKDVFRFGLELKCPNCELTFWDVIDNIKTKSICEYCGNEFHIANQLKDRNWAYRRSGIFGLEDHQAGGIPVSVTLEQLLRYNHSDVFIYVTSMEISSSGAVINKCESDFIILTCDYHGNTSIIISECKTRGEITTNDVTNLTKVADALSNKHINTYILYSKLDEFTTDEADRCLQGQEKYRDRVILLSDRELEGQFIYQEAKKKFQINEHATSWEGMALNTKAMYSGKQLNE